MNPDIPYDVYETPQELVIILPLGWVEKESVEISLNEYRLVIKWERKKPKLKDDYKVLKEDCYRGKLEKDIDLPPQVYFDRIHSKLSADNILEIIIPKVVIPEKIEVEVE